VQQAGARSSGDESHSNPQAMKGEPVRQKGLTLLELLVVIAIVGMTCAVSFPAFRSINGRRAVRAAAGEIRTAFNGARSRALSTSRNCGLKFTLSAGEWKYALYDDGDGDGVRNEDIASGIDRQLTRPRRVLELERRAAISLPPVTMIDPDGDPLPPTKPPVQFNKSAICSFSPTGTATPGTIYLTDAAGDAWCVRVLGASAKTRLLRYNWLTKKWEAK
jgi:prepilin-type N-terminal cleavage/methylation domain-containing protein